MIPLSLRLKNFMAYRTTEPLDFSEFHVACLSGENGAGKSTLLDAITWALWGKARVNSDDSLIHLGESEMEVEFRFELNQHIYRVLRRRNSSGRGKSELHLQAEEDVGLRTLSESGIRATQAKIDRLMGLDYETFINSAFLLQGQADAFTAKRPAERKQILSDILGLGMYDTYAERAREKSRAAKEAIRKTEGQIAQIESELKRQGEYRAQLKESQVKIAELNQAYLQADATLRTQQATARELAYKNNQLSDLQDRLKNSQTEIEALQKSLPSLKDRLANFETILNQAETIETGYAKHQAAEKTVEDWDKRQAKNAELEKKLRHLEQKLNTARSQLQQEAAKLKQKLSDQRELATQAESLAEKMASLDEELAQFAAVEKERDAQREQINQLNNEKSRLEQHNLQLKEEMERIRNRLDQLKTAGASCPICTQALSESHRAEVEAEFQDEGTTKGDSYRANKDRLTAIAEELKTAQTALKQAEKTLRGQRKVERQHATLENKLETARKAAEGLPALEKSLAEVEATLAEENFEPDTQAELKAVQAEKESLAYDSTAHQTARAEVKALAHFVKESLELENARAHVEETQTRLAEDEARLERLLTQTASDRETLAQLKEETAALPQLEKEIVAQGETVSKLEAELTQAKRENSAAKQMLNFLAEKAEELGELEENLLQQRETQAIYQELVNAFGKRGVQALLIDHAIPELEDEANAILSRMTDGRMSLQFITQRNTKSTDNIIETLEIRIADEIGTRNYDLYSGGEAFRINFAIRLALSHLLARRSGAKLQTLVIDEGFGTQDAQGRERLVEAITKIQNDFEKIIIITHLEELKDAFPKRINVYKTADGSQISFN